MPATKDPMKAIAWMEAQACDIPWKETREKKVDEMMRYTKVILGERAGKPAPVMHEGVPEYGRRGELIGFYLKPIVKEFIKQL